MIFLAKATWAQEVRAPIFKAFKRKLDSHIPDILSFRITDSCIEEKVGLNGLYDSKH